MIIIWSGPSRPSIPKARSTTAPNPSLSVSRTIISPPSSKVHSLPRNWVSLASSTAGNWGLRVTRRSGRKMLKILIGCNCPCSPKELNSYLRKGSANLSRRNHPKIQLNYQSSSPNWNTRWAEWSIPRGPTLSTPSTTILRLKSARQKNYHAWYSGWLTWWSPSTSREKWLSLPTYMSIGRAVRRKGWTAICTWERWRRRQSIKLLTRFMGKLWSKDRIHHKGICTYKKITLERNPE